MASRGNKTTTAKRVREAKLRERRLEKQARKEARRLAAAEQNDTAADQPDAPPEPEAPTD